MKSQLALAIAAMPFDTRVYFALECLRMLDFARPTVRVIGAWLSRIGRLDAPVGATFDDFQAAAAVSREFAEIARIAGYGTLPRPDWHPAAAAAEAAKLVALKLQRDCPSFYHGYYDAMVADRRSQSLALTTAQLVEEAFCTAAIIASSGRHWIDNSRTADAWATAAEAIKARQSDLAARLITGSP